METHTRHERRARGSGHASDRVTRTSLTPSADAPGLSVTSITVPPRSIAPASVVMRPPRDPYRESIPRVHLVTRSNRGTEICRCLDQRPVSGLIPHAAGFDSRGSHHVVPLQAAGIAPGEEIGASGTSPTGMTGKGAPAGLHSFSVDMLAAAWMDTREYQRQRAYRRQDSGQAAADPGPYTCGPKPLTVIRGALSRILWSRSCGTGSRNRVRPASTPHHRPRRTAAEVSGELPSDLVCPSPEGPSAYEEVNHAA